MTGPAWKNCSCIRGKGYERQATIELNSQQCRQLIVQNLNALDSHEVVAIYQLMTVLIKEPGRLTVPTYDVPFE